MSGSNALDGRGALLQSIANPQIVNPLKAETDANQAAIGFYNVRKAQADQAWGNALQAATDENGNVDYQKAQALAAKNPMAAMGMRAALTDTSRLTTEQQTRGAKAGDETDKAIVSALASPNDQLHATVVQQMQRLIDTGTIPRDQALKIMLGLSDKPEQLRDQLERIRISRLPPDQQRTQLYGGGGTMVGEGGATVGTVHQPSGGLGAGGTRPTGTLSAPPQPGVVTGLTPAQLAEQVEGPPGPDGQPTKETLEQRLRRQGTIVPGMPEYRPPAGSGLPSSLRNPNAQPPPAPAAATPAPGPRPAVTGQSPAQTAAQTATGTSSAAAFDDISKQAVSARSRGAVLDNMLSATTQFTSGPAADRILLLRQWGERLGIPVNKDATASAEEFRKLAAQLNQNQGSDARLAVSEASNPHADLSPAGLNLMMKQLRGNEDYLEARAALAAKWGDKANSQKFETDVGSKLDPRAFQFARMNGEQRRKYVATLKGGEREKLEAAYNFAHENGLIR